MKSISRWMPLALFLASNAALAAPPDVRTSSKIPIMTMENPHHGSDLSQASSPRTAAHLVSYAEAASYMPLRKGNLWEYDLEVRAGRDPVKRFKAVRVVKGTQQIADREYFRLVTEVKEGGIRVPDQFYRVSEEGLMAAAQGAPGKELLVVPRSPAAQSTWSGKAEPSIAKFAGSASLHEVFRHGEHEFRECVKVSLQMTIVDRSFFGGQTETPVHFERWFAPGVGMVHEIRRVGEPGNDDYLESDSKLNQFQLGE